jgi:transposase
MMGTKAYQEKMFYNFSLSERVSQDHFLRKVAKVVDLSFVRKLVKRYYSYTGQPSIDPIVLFKMMLIGYFYGITSERRLAEEVSLNMAYMWYLGYDLDESTPNHSVISKARIRYGKEVFEQFFQEVLGLCAKTGLVDGEKVFVDSTLIKANASLKSLVPRQDLVELKFSPKEYVDRVFSENPVEESSVEDCSPKVVDEKKIEKSKRKQRGGANKSLVSTTDPDASVYQRPGVPYQLAYKEHVAVDSKARVVTAVKVTPAAVTDDRVLPDLIDDQPTKPKEVCADKIYGSVDIYAHLFDRDILPSIPRRSTGGWRYTGGFPTDNFVYDKKHDFCICPANQILKRKGRSYRWHWTVYKAEKGKCKACKLRSQCAGGESGRSVIRYDRQDALDFALAHLKTQRAKATIKQRKIYPETIFAEAKNSHGLRRATCRGLDKVIIQALLTCAVQNIKRLIKHFYASGSNSIYIALKQFHSRTKVLLVPVT